MMLVLVTGATKGIGKAICEKFLSCGHKVIGMDILPSGINDKNYTHYEIDVCSTDLPEISDVDILINNAGIQTESIKDIEVNLNGAINITEKYGVQPNIKSIVNIASASARTGAEFPHYVASKGGLVAYTKNVAQRIAKYNACCNAISPGGVITELNSHILNDSKLYEAVKNEALLKKWTDVNEIAEWVYFLAVINKSMTGEDLLIDNGEALNFNFIW